MAKRKPAVRKQRRNSKRVSVSVADLKRVYNAGRRGRGVKVKVR